MPGPDPAFWESLYAERRTPWDDGSTDPQLLSWLDDATLAPSAGRVLVPGCGSGRDVALLAARGFEVLGLDYAGAAVQLARERLAAIGSAGLRGKVEQADVLSWQPDAAATAPIAAIFERTCLCALHPDHWTAYARRLHAWLPSGGRLFAQFEQVLRAGAADGRIEGPPYHCDIHAMRALFPSPLWLWPKPPYPRGPRGDHLALVLVRC